MRGITTKTPERVAEAQRLRDEGLKYIEIAVRLGVARSTISIWLSDPDLAKAAARRARYAGRCVDCGAATDGSGGHASPRTRCIGCSWRHQRENSRWTQEAIVAALRRWNDEHGQPPTATQWIAGGEWWPTRTTVRGRWGTWNAAIAAAGFEPLRPGQCRRRVDVEAVAAGTTC